MNPLSGSVFLLLINPEACSNSCTGNKTKGGFVIYYKRLESGRVANLFRGCNLSFKEMRWDEIVMLMEGINLSSKRRKRYNLQEENLLFSE